MSLRRGVIALLIFLSTFIRLSAQEKSSQVDSLVRLLSAQSMQLIEKDGVDYRKVTGPARFLHNDTYLICDTALWNVNTNEIFAIGNVKILQEQTVLTGDRLTYYVDRNLAEFRGSLVQLEDKDRNVLRTEYLDYDTKDSVAVFFNGGSMRDKDGQVIESQNGRYESKDKLFTFIDDVNMFTDSIFVKSATIQYDASVGKAIFGALTDAWHEDNMLSANAGWYDRNREVFLFRDRVHGMSPQQEGWADSLFYFRNTGDLELLGNAQVTDTARNMSAVAGRMFYTDSLSRLEMTRMPAVVGVLKEENSVPDTVYFGADTLIARSVMKFNIGDGVQAASDSRMEALSVDAVQAYRRKAAKEAAEAAAKAAENDPNRPKSRKDSKPVPDNAEGKAPLPDEESEPGISETAGDETLAGLSESADSLSVIADSLSVKADSLFAGADSLAHKADSAVAPLDSTKVDFITAINRVRLYKSDFQLACDSLEYNGLDSLVRMYKSPVVWNEENRQYSADSLFAVIRNNSLQKASLMSNAFIIVQEDSLCFDQIRSAEMLAYFDTTGALSRFDAMGDASAVFYLQEDSVYATVNKSAAKMLYAVFKDGDLDKVHYFESAQNDGYPVAQMTREERVLKGFNWQPDRRPRGRNDITPLELRVTERPKYAARPRTTFRFTDKYFPGYMSGVYKKMEKDRQAKAEKDAAARSGKEAAAVSDSASVADSLVNAADSLKNELSAADTLKNASGPSAGAGGLAEADSSAVRDTSALIRTEPKDSLRQARLAAKQAKIAAKEAKWARLDSLDAARVQAKADRKAAKLRARKLKQLKAMKEQDDKDNARLEKYKELYRKRKSRTADS